MVWLVGLGPGGFGFYGVHPRIPIPFIRGIQKSKPPTKTNNEPLAEEFCLKKQRGSGSMGGFFSISTSGAKHLEVKQVL